MDKVAPDAIKLSSKHGRNVFPGFLKLETGAFDNYVISQTKEVLKIFPRSYFTQGIGSHYEIKFISGFTFKVS